jgi:hypothetical protein
MIDSGEKLSMSHDNKGLTIAGLKPDTKAVPDLSNFTGAFPYEAFKFQNITFGKA